MAQRGAVARLRHLVTAVGAAKEEVMCTCGCGEVAKECGCPSAVAAIAAAGSSAEPAQTEMAIVDYDVEALEATTMFNTEAGGDPNAPLTEEQISHFLVEGYIPLPGILDADHIELLKNDVDQVTLDRADAHANKLPHPNNVSYEHMGKLCSHPPTVNKVKQLMRAYGNGRDDFAMHHINASRFDAGAGSSPWHQVRLPPWCAVPRCREL